MEAKDGITVIVPCYNEAPDVLRETVDDILASLAKVDGMPHEVIVVDDGSKKHRYDDFNDEARNVRVIRHIINKGYGGGLKTGIKNSKYEWIGITDADGTYPNKDFHEMIAQQPGYDMIVGARSWKDISLIRKGPKWILTRFASFLANYNIHDLNSGMRIFRKSMALQFWRLYPDGFSFTSTISMGCVTNGYFLKYMPIEYFKRVGKSYINPIKDTVRFFSLVTRLVLYFKPLRFFTPITFIILALAIARGLRDYLLEGSFGGLTLLLFFMGFQTFFFGLLAEVISKNNKGYYNPD